MPLNEKYNRLLKTKEVEIKSGRNSQKKLKNLTCFSPQSH
jgi:hypothetical protein